MAGQMLLKFFVIESDSFAVPMYEGCAICFPYIRFVFYAWFKEVFCLLFVEFGSSSVFTFPVSEIYFYFQFRLCEQLHILTNFFCFFFRDLV